MPTQTRAHKRGRLVSSLTASETNDALRCSGVHDPPTLYVNWNVENHYFVRTAGLNSARPSVDNTTPWPRTSYADLFVLDEFASEHFQ